MFCLHPFKNYWQLFSSCLNYCQRATITSSPREYFEPEAPERNMIPVVNTNFSSDQVLCLLITCFLISWFTLFLTHIANVFSQHRNIPVVNTNLASDQVALFFLITVQFSYLSSNIYIYKDKLSIQWRKVPIYLQQTEEKLLLLTDRKRSKGIEGRQN